MNNTILDSGERTVFETGAVRDMKGGQGRCDLLPLSVIRYLFPEDLVLAELADGHYLVALDNFIQEYYPNHETAMLELSKHFEDGARKYGEYNWQKGIPIESYLDSALRHYFKFLRGDDDEPHDRAFMWNVVCMLWTMKKRPRTEEEIEKANKQG